MKHDIVKRPKLRRKLTWNEKLAKLNIRSWEEMVKEARSI